MRKSMKVTLKKAAAAMLATVLSLSVTACGGKQEGSADSGDRTVIYYAASYVTAQVRDAYLEMVETYNNGQGKKDGVYVQMTDSSGVISGLDSALRTNYMYDVLQINDDEYKALAMQGQDYFTVLDEYLTDDVKKEMAWDDIPENLINRFRFNSQPDENGNYLAGEGMNFCYRSKNMMDWEPMGNALGEWKYDDEGKIEEACKVVWADVWAPEVVYDPEEEFYYMFFSATPQADEDVTTASSSGSARRMLLVARSKFPYMDFELVNFKDAKSCGEENLHTFSSDSFPHYYAKYLMLEPNIYNEFVDKNGGDTERHNYGGYSSTIDAHAYVDENGDKYLFWKDELIEDRICGVKMDNWLKPDWSTATVLMYEGYYTVEDYWKAEQGQVVEEVSYESNNAQNNEAPTVIKHNGKYYMIFSMGNYSDNSYQAAQAVADNILGPYRKLREEEGGLLLAGGKVGSQDLTGLGHQDLVTIGEQLYIIYHRHDDAMVGGGTRNPAIDEIRWITIQDESGKDLDVMYVNGPTCTVQPRIEAYSTYSNIADEATVSGIEEAQYLTDGLLSICKYGNESFMQYIKESTIKETSTVVFDFDSARSVSAIMVYNSKMEDTSFMKVSNVEFICVENGQEVVRYIDDIKFSPEFYRANDLDNSMYYITPGAAAYAEFEELNVKSVRITVEVPEGQEAVGISEIRILGK